MKRWASVALLGMAVLAMAMPARGSGSAEHGMPQVLVLYDTAGPYGALGESYAIMVRNLLGHFPVQVTSVPVTEYATVRSIAATRVFYIGSTFDEVSYHPPGSSQRASYEMFLADVARGRRTVWLGHNLASIAWAWDPAWGTATFADRFGFAVLGYDDAPAYNRVRYKDTELDKGVVRHVQPGADVSRCRVDPEGLYGCDLGIVRTIVTDPALAQVQADAFSTITGATDPYVIRTQSLWFFADIPFTYLSEEDRYLAFADLLHDQLSSLHPQTHRAMVRLEDVSPDSEVSDLAAVEQVLDRHRAPFGVALIPFYEDPDGAYNDGRRESKRLQGSAVATVMRRWQTEGVSIVQHGTSHQWSGGANPYNRVTGDDFEFFRVTEEPDFSLRFLSQIYSGDGAAKRMTVGANELRKAKITAFAWEAPHYAAGPQDWAAVAKVYPTAHYGRVLYFPTSSDRFVGQFFPYQTRDTYGQLVLPENLGNISPEVWKGYAASHPQDVIRRAAKARVVRDGFASFYFHPYLDPALLDQTLTGIEALGFTFVQPCAIFAACP